MNKIVKRVLSAMAVGALLASIGCAVQPAGPGTGETTQPASGTTAHFERLGPDDPIENLRAMTQDEQRLGVVEDLACRPPLIDCYCGGSAWCTTRTICFKVCDH